MFTFASCCSATCARGQEYETTVQEARTPVADKERPHLGLLLGHERETVAEDLLSTKLSSGSPTAAPTDREAAEDSAGGSPVQEGCTDEADPASTEVSPAPRDEPASLASEEAPQLCANELKALQACKQELAGDRLAAVQANLVPGESLDSCLLRFLRQTNLRVPQAAKLLTAHLAWRGTMRPADLAELSQGEVAGCSESLLQSYMPTWHQGIDRQGRPVVFSHYGKFRFRPILEAGVTVEKILRLHVRNSEVTARLCGQQSERLGRDVSNALIIMDTEGWDPQNCRTLAAFDWARGLAKIDQEHYPQRMGQLLILNAPPAVYCFYKAASWFLPEKARQQVRIFAGKDQWLPVLQELVAPEQLPPEYGGTGEPLGSCKQASGCDAAADATLEL